MKVPFSNIVKREDLSGKAYLFLCGRACALSLAVLFLFFLPYSAWWLAKSGDLAVEEAVDEQAKGSFVLFGSGVSQDFVDYKLRLYKEVRPTIVAIGSSRVMQFRSSAFSSKFLNMGGVAGNIPVLRSTIDAMLRIHKPEAVIIGLDFWWFMPAWNADPFMEEPPTSGSYAYGLEALKKPWTWLLEGKISWRDFLAPVRGLLGEGFRGDRFGIMAQQTDDGFGPDGSWYYTGESTGQKKPFDYRFQDTMSQVVGGAKAFYHVKDPADAPSSRHLDAFAEIYCRLQSRGIRTFVFIPPLAEKIYLAVREREAFYPHLFSLAGALQSRGINVLDVTDPRRLFSGDCEFVDGFHGGEVTYLRILRSLCDQWAALLPYVDIDELNRRILEWQGHTLVHDDRLTPLFEVDSQNFGCPKKKSVTPPSPEPKDQNVMEENDPPRSDKEEKKSEKTERQKKRHGESHRNSR
ncbi:MAG: hypothetical protein K5657_02545 [Desulfovibrio sp.]|nr:hypothetical protein [Desulfovibrio sp.]